MIMLCQCMFIQSVQIVSYLLCCFLVEETITILAYHIKLHRLPVLLIRLFGPNPFDE